MKKLSKLKLQSLDDSEMKQIKGGVSPEDYCCTVTQQFVFNWGNWNEEQREAGNYAWNLCFGDGGYFEEGLLCD